MWRSYSWMLQRKHQEKMAWPVFWHSFVWLQVLNSKDVHMRLLGTCRLAEDEDSDLEAAVVSFMPNKIPGLLVCDTKGTIHFFTLRTNLLPFVCLFRFRFNDLPMFATSMSTIHHNGRYTVFVGSENGAMYVADLTNVVVEYIAPATQTIAADAPAPMQHRAQPVTQIRTSPHRSRILSLKTIERLGVMISCGDDRLRVIWSPEGQVVGQLDDWGRAEVLPPSLSLLPLPLHTVHIATLPLTTPSPSSQSPPLSTVGWAAHTCEVHVHVHSVGPVHTTAMQPQLARTVELGWCHVFTLSVH